MTLDRSGVLYRCYSPFFLDCDNSARFYPFLIFDMFTVVSMWALALGLFSASLTVFFSSPCVSECVSWGLFYVGLCGFKFTGSTFYFFCVCIHMSVYIYVCVILLYIYMYIYICIHFFINTNFVERSRHFLSTYFLVDRSYCRFAFIAFGGNWLMYFP